MEKAEGRPSEGGMEALGVSGDESMYGEGRAVTGTEIGAEWWTGATGWRSRATS